MGRTRIEDAPRGAQRPEQADDLGGVDDGVHGVHVAARERQHGRGVEARQQREHLRQALVARVEHDVALRARRQHRVDQQAQLLGQLALLRREVAARDQHGLRLEQGLELDEAVLAQRVAARDEVDDRVGGVQARRQLDRSAERDHAAR